MLATEARDRLAELDPALLAQAAAALVDPGISVVEAALAAADLGARALHDPTEGGLATGLAELADASRVGITLDRAPVRWFRRRRANPRSRI